jgi:site-specific recombinase XerD
MGEPARVAIEAYLHDGRPALLKRRAKKVGVETAMFVNRFGTRLTQRAIQILVRKYALKAGLDERVHPHLLRHSFATHLLDNGAELRVVQELLGHTNPNTTQIYLHVTETRQRSVMESSQDELAAVEMARRTLRGQRRSPSEA